MNRITSFLRDKGFYLALVACILAAAASSAWAIRTVVDRMNDDPAVSDPGYETEEEFTWDWPDAPVEQKTEDVPVEPAPLQPSSQPQPQASASSAPSAVPEPSTPPADAAASPYVWPVSGQIAAACSGDELVYNATLGDWRTHNGIDIACAGDAAVKAAALGEVTAVFQDAVWGWTVEVSDGDRIYRYQGLAKPEVKAGDRVRAGDRLGLIGTVPAEADLGTHLHFEVQESGRYTDPAALLG